MITRNAAKRFARRSAGAGAYALLALVGLHIAAVLLMSRLAKENLILAIVTGRKRADRHPAARDAAPPARLAAPAAAIAVGVAVYGAILVDPPAFALHADDEAGERGEVGGEETERDDD